MSDDDSDSFETGRGSAALLVRRVRPAYEQVAAQLRDLIIRGDIVAGERLPVESELPSLFGVSRSTIREALRVLSSQSLVQTRRGVRGGTFVAKPEPEYVRDYLEASLGLMTVDDSMTIDDLIEVREMLEVPAARLAAERRTNAHVDAMEALLRPRGGSSAPMGYDETRGFHEIILDGARNALLEMVTRPIFRVIGTRIDRSHAAPRFWREVSEDHRKIAAAVAAGDGAGAAEGMLVHLEHVRVYYYGLDRQRPEAQRSARARRAKSNAADGKRSQSAAGRRSHGEVGRRSSPAANGRRSHSS